MNELPIGTTFREAIYLTSATSSEQDSLYKFAPIGKKFNALKRRLHICTERPCFTVTWKELYSPVPFARTLISNFIQNTITTEGKN